MVCGKYEPRFMRVMNVIFLKYIIISYKPGVCISLLSFVSIDTVKFVDIEGNEIDITMA